MMDLDDFRTILDNSGVDIWGFIKTAIKVASLDYKDEFRGHRDGIVAKLYANCPNCDVETRVRASSGNGFVGNAVVEAVFGGEEEGHNEGHSPYNPVSIGRVKGEVEEEGHNKGHSPYNPVPIGRVKGEVEEEGHNKGHSPYNPVSIGRVKGEVEEGGHNKGHSPYNPVSIGGVKGEVEEERHNKGHSPYNPVSIGGVKDEVDEGHNKGHSPYTPVSVGGDEVEEDEEEGGHGRKMEEQRYVDDEDGYDPYDEERRVIAIKEQIEDPNQSEESLVDLLQTLADMDITFRALKETDIGRHVNRLRKHPSNDVKRLVKLLVRTWKDLVDDWVKSNATAKGQSSNLTADGDSPQQNFPKNQHNSHHNQVPDFGYSPNPHNGSFGSDKSEYKPKAIPSHGTPLGRNPPVKPAKTIASAASAPQPNRQKQVAVDPERLASARRRLQENYQEAQNAKKQRTIQVMDIHELPKGKAKNSFFGRKGGFQRH